MAAKEGSPTRAIVAATIGNALEFYDFITYGFFAIQIGHAFFPSTSAYASLMLSLAAFGAGFLTRPLGGIFIGRYADRVGRRPAMILSFLMMGSAIVALALIPSYATIGIAAPILAIFARMVQGFSLGGEVGPTTAFLLESAPPQHRGYYVSWQAASQGIASITAGVIGFALSLSLSHAALDAYGWRIAFMIGAVTLPFGLWVRRNVPETLHAAEPDAIAKMTGRGFLNAVRGNRRIMVTAFLVLMSGTIGTYVSSYLITFAQNTLHMTPAIAFAASVVRDIMSLLGALAGGFLSDRFGRRPLMIGPRVVGLIFIYPVYAWVVQSRSEDSLFIGIGLLTFVGAMWGGAFYPAFSESLPKAIRGGAIAIIYATSIAIFGGTTQLVVTWLLHVTGNPMALAWYLIAASSIGLGAMFFIFESAPSRLTAKTVAVPAE